MEKLIRELLFADDAALLAHTEAAMQRITSCFAKTAQHFGLEVSLKKTEVLYQPAPHEEHHPPSIFIEQTELKVVHQFSYLGCVILSDTKIDQEVDNRLAKAISTFGRLYKRVRNNSNLKRDTKVRVYKAVVLTILLYGAESWVTYRRHLSLLEHFRQRCLRTILNIHWSDFVANTEVLELAEVTSIEAMVLKIQLRWAGHIARMENHRLPKIVLYGELSSGYRDIGAPRKRYKDSLKKSLTACCIDHRQWATQAADRNSWRHTVHQATSFFEDTRRACMED
uniref:Reverse transcriptase domain-containing protein n=1 Tax=Pelodiscus sinensis TaxID=13735 RepID=K7EZV3_PELSI